MMAAVVGHERFLALTLDDATASELSQRLAFTSSRTFFFHSDYAKPVWYLSTSTLIRSNVPLSHSGSISMPRHFRGFENTGRA
jgi:hypothetical protein